jgi:hypothetical protein
VIILVGRLRIGPGLGASHCGVCLPCKERVFKAQVVHMHNWTRETGNQQPPAGFHSLDAVAPQKRQDHKIYQFHYYQILTNAVLWRVARFRTLSYNPVSDSFPIE